MNTCQFPEAGFMKGANLGHMRAYAAATSREIEWDRFAASLPGPCKEIVDSLDETAWYPASLLAEINRLFVQDFGNGDLAIAEELGKFSAERDFASPLYSWYFDLVPLEYAVEHLDTYWRGAHDTGRWEGELEGNTLVARLEGWCVVEKPLCHRTKSYFGHALELAGFKVTSTHPVCRADGAEHCVFHFYLRPAGTQSRRDKPFSRAEVGSVAATLNHIVHKTSLVDAIMRLLRDHLACPHIELRLIRHNDGELMRVRCHGAQQELSRVHVLNATRGPVGQLIIGAPRSWSKWNDEYWDDLIRCFTDALANLPDESGSAPSTERVVDEIAQEYGIPPRRREYLRLKATGLSNQKIAAELHVKEFSVEKQITKIYQMLGVRNRDELINLVLSWSRMHSKKRR